MVSAVTTAISTAEADLTTIVIAVAGTAVLVAVGVAGIRLAIKALNRGVGK
jgi:hypothetical protein